MPNVQANGIKIEYEEIGSPLAPPLLLIHGLGTQMVLWPDEFCGQLAARGFRVIRFDNRDVGLSTKFDEQCPDPVPLQAQVMAGEAVDAPYTLNDMAADAVALLGVLGIGSAHIVGASMGGMIAQLVAIDHPQATLSLTSIMSTPNPRWDEASPEVVEASAQPLPSGRAEAIAQGVEMWRVLNGPGFEFDEELMRKAEARAYDRSVDTAGRARQSIAILTNGDRTRPLGNVKAPTLVIHGDGDPLVPVSGGYATAEAVPGAKMVVIEGMGHELPRGAWAQMIDAIAKHAGAGAGA